MRAEKRPVKERHETLRSVKCVTYPPCCSVTPLVKGELSQKEHFNVSFYIFKLVGLANHSSYDSFTLPGENTPRVYYLKVQLSLHDESKKVLYSFNVFTLIITHSVGIGYSIKTGLWSRRVLFSFRLITSRDINNDN